jgi:hypothetical protein
VFRYFSLTWHRATDPSIWADREEQIYSATLNAEQIRSVCATAIPADVPALEDVLDGVARLGSSVPDNESVNGVAG